MGVWSDFKKKRERAQKHKEYLRTYAEYLQVEDDVQRMMNEIPPDEKGVIEKLKDIKTLTCEAEAMLALCYARRNPSKTLEIVKQKYEWDKGRGDKPSFPVEVAIYEYTMGYKENGTESFSHFSKGREVTIPSYEPEYFRVIPQLCKACMAAKYFYGDGVNKSNYMAKMYCSNILENDLIPEGYSERALVNRIMKEIAEEEEAERRKEEQEKERARQKEEQEKERARQKEEQEKAERASPEKYVKKLLSQVQYNSKGIEIEKGEGKKIYDEMKQVVCALTGKSYSDDFELWKDMLSSSINEDLHKYAFYAVSALVMQYDKESGESERRRLLQEKFSNSQLKELAKFNYKDSGNELLGHYFYDALLTKKGTGTIDDDGLFASDYLIYYCVKYDYMKDAYFYGDYALRARELAEKDYCYHIHDWMMQGNNGYFLTDDRPDENGMYTDHGRIRAGAFRASAIYDGVLG